MANQNRRNWAILANRDNPRLLQCLLWLEDIETIVRSLTDCDGVSPLDSFLNRLDIRHGATWTLRTFECRDIVGGLIITITREEHEMIPFLRVVIYRAVRSEHGGEQARLVITRDIRFIELVIEEEREKLKKWFSAALDRARTTVESLVPLVKT